MAFFIGHSIWLLYLYPGFWIEELLVCYVIFFLLWLVSVFLFAMPSLFLILAKDRGKEEKWKVTGQHGQEASTSPIPINSGSRFGASSS